MLVQEFRVKILFPKRKHTFYCEIKNTSIYFGVAPTTTMWNVHTSIPFFPIMIESPWSLHKPIQFELRIIRALEKETLATVTRFAHVREYNTKIIIGLGHMFHALSLLLRLRLLLMLLRGWMVRIFGYFQVLMILIHGMTDGNVGATSVLVALLIVDNTLRVWYIQLGLWWSPVIA